MLIFFRFLEFYTREDADNFVKEGDGRELLGNPVRLCCLGPQKLLPEYSAKSRSPPHVHSSRRSSPSRSSFARHGRSRSRSPIPSRQYRYNTRNSSTPQRSSVPPIPTSRRNNDESLRRVEDRDDHNERYHYPPRQRKQHEAQSNLKAEGHDFQVNASYYKPGDYIDVWAGRDTDKMESQWIEYSSMYYNSSS
jgi:hypothetical protein